MDEQDRIMRPILRVPPKVQAEIDARRAAAAGFPVGSSVRARSPLAHPRPGEVAQVIDMTEDGDLRLHVASQISGFTALARPEALALVQPEEVTPDDIDTAPF